MAQSAPTGWRKKMSEDARNSISLWVGGLAFFGLFWAGLYLDIFRGVWDSWFGVLLAIAVAINIGLTVRGFWRRRASSPNNPNDP
jgi:hypothetical protein